MLAEVSEHVKSADRGDAAAGSPAALRALDNLENDYGHLNTPGLGKWMHSLAENGKAVVNNDVNSAKNQQHQQLDKRWKSEVYEFCRVIDGLYPLNPSTLQDARPDDFSSFFQPGGILDNFEKSLQGQKDPLPPSLSALFEKAKHIRQMFFSAGVGGLAVSFTLRPLETDPSVQQSLLDFGGVRLEHQNGASSISGTTFKWPGQMSDYARLDLTVNPSEPPQFILFDSSPWAWLRLLEQASVYPNGNNYSLRFTVGQGKLGVSYLFTPGALDPFDSSKIKWLRSFHCPSHI